MTALSVVALEIGVLPALGRCLDHFGLFHRAETCRDCYRSHQAYLARRREHDAMLYLTTVPFQVTANR